MKTLIRKIAVATLALCIAASMTQTASAIFIRQRLPDGRTRRVWVPDGTNRPPNWSKTSTPQPSTSNASTPATTLSIKKSSSPWLVQP